MGSSRIFENGSMKYDPKLCDKFEAGDPLPGRIDWCQHINRRDEDGREETDNFGRI